MHGSMRGWTHGHMGAWKHGHMGHMHGAWTRGGREEWKDERWRWGMGDTCTIRVGRRDTVVEDGLWAMYLQQDMIGGRVGREGLGGGPGGGRERKTVWMGNGYIRYDTRGREWKGEGGEE